jgi:hypothetical protein
MPNDSRKMMEKMRIDNAKKTYLGQRMLGVEIMGGQVRNCVILGELGKIPDPLVGILLLNQIFRDSRRIYQARVTPKLGETMLQGLNLTLYKKAMSWIPDRAPPLPPFRVWIWSSSGAISFISASVGGKSHDANFFNSLEASKGAKPYSSSEEALRSLM